MKASFAKRTGPSGPIVMPHLVARINFSLPYFFKALPTNSSFVVLSSPSDPND